MKQELIAAATEARKNAYAPYSNYAVGAAILDEADRIHAGTNVENVSFPVGMCAERVAIGKMISDGSRKIRAIAVITRDGGTPCGMCLQALSEFTDDSMSVRVFCVSESGLESEFVLADLLPHGFKTDL